MESLKQLEVMFSISNRITIHRKHKILGTFTDVFVFGCQRSETELVGI